jgi:hypothetical protein
MHVTVSGLYWKAMVVCWEVAGTVDTMAPLHWLGLRGECLVQR